MGSKKNVDMSATTDTIKIVADPTQIIETDQPVADAEGTVEAAAEPAKKKQTGHRSARYHHRRSQVDKTKLYDPFAAIELLKRLSYTKFAGSVEVHGMVREVGMQSDVLFPHATGKSVRVAIVSPEVMAKIEAGTIDFDILIAKPGDMPTLTKHARVLGPRGLMPNPKNGTLTDNPEAKKKDFESGKTTIKTEKKAPLFHTVIGKTSMETKDLVENLQALIKAFKGKLVRLSISATMSPGIKVTVE
jgi:large subunit ribosomal protein L1